MFDLSAFIKENATPGKKFKIKLLGDSITHGHSGTGYEQNGYPFIKGYARNPNGYCWANLFKEYMENKFSCEVVNNGASGTKIEFIIDNFETLVEKDDDFIICTIGTNNRHQMKNSGAKKTKAEMEEGVYANILKLNSMLVESNKTVVFIANIPAAPERETDKEDSWRILHMNDINDIYKRAHQEKGFLFISLYDLFSEYLKENKIELGAMLADGLHPNDKGYKVIYELLKKALNV